MVTYSDTLTAESPHGAFRCESSSRCSSPMQNHSASSMAHDREDDDQQRQPQRPTKRARTDSGNTAARLTRPHPFNVKPSGNQLLPGAVPSCRPAGLGVLHTAFTDDLILTLLHHLSIIDITVLSQCSRALYVYCHDEDRCRAAVLAATRGDFLYQGTWRETFIYYHVRRTRGAIAAVNEISRQRSLPPPPVVHGFYSDTLFASYYCSAIDLAQFNGNENVDRVHTSDYTHDRLLRDYLIPNRPVVLTGVVSQWAASHWTEQSLEAEYGSVRFKVGAYEMSLAQYLHYHRHTMDESPLYLFDSDFIDKCPAMAEQFTVPEFASHDYFELLESLPAYDGYNDGCEDRETPGAHGGRITGSGGGKGLGTMRPAYRWILIGPPRSGSTFHKDPNHTSAWNGLLTGRKRWILYPPDSQVPGVFPSEDGRDVVTPISVTEWFNNFYQAHRQIIQPHSLSNANTRTHTDYDIDSELAYSSNPTSYAGYGPIECVCEPGDLLFIPNGWWHIALNEQHSIALTANFVSNQNLLNVHQFLIEEGNTALSDALDRQLQMRCPGLLDRLRAVRDQQEAEQLKQNVPKKSLWDTVSDASTGGSLTFSFALSDENQATTETDESTSCDM